MNVALFGGTFDPVHSGHIAAAREAAKCFALDEIHFVPATIPPHKQHRPLSAFAHRYAMVSLACAEEPRFVPSLLEAHAGRPNYSIDTVRKMRSMLEPEDRLYFVVGADAFRGISTWHQPEALLDACDFIVVSRPGFPLEHIESAIPPAQRGGLSARGESGVVEATIALRRTCLHLLTTVHADISSSHIRKLAARGESLEGLVPENVAEYIRKVNLFRDEVRME